ncbi:PAS domain S-box protein [Paracraurococcus lichenis]
MMSADDAKEASRWRLLEVLPTPCLVLLPDAPRYTVVTANGVFLRITMTEHAAVVGHAAHEVIPGLLNSRSVAEDQDLRASLTRVVETQAPDRMPTRRCAVRRPDGSFEERHWTPVSSPVLNSRGEVEAIIHHIEDDTATVLREREDRLRAAIELSAHILWTAGPDGRVVEIDPRWETVTGLARADALGDGWMRIPHPDDRAQMAAAWQRAVAGGEPYDADARLGMVDGSYRWWRARAAPRRGADGRILRWHGVIEDIHDRKAAEIALRSERERLRLIFESATDYAIFAIDLDRRVTSWNEGARRLLGWTADEIAGKSADEIYLPQDQEDGAPAREAAKALENGRAINERWHQRKNGSRFWASGLLMPLRDPEAGPGSPPLGLLKILRDTTERRRAEERRRLLVNELNHRVKNTLAMVQSLAFQTVRGSPDPLSFSAAFQKRIIALAHAHDLLTREHWEGVALHEVVRATVGLLSGGGRVSLSRCTSAMMLAPGAVLTLVLVLHELAANALAHGALSDARGTVRVECHDSADDGGGAVVEWLERGGPVVPGSPARRGFGLRLLGKGIMGAAGMAAEIRFEPEGIHCILRLRPLSAGADTRPT